MCILLLLVLLFYKCRLHSMFDDVMEFYILAYFMSNCFIIW